MTGSLVALSMVKELGPVLTGLMVSGRNASGMASELGSMKVTEQIDAMRALGTDPSASWSRPASSPPSSCSSSSPSCPTRSASPAAPSSRLHARPQLHLLPHTSYQSLVYGDVVQGLTKPLFSGFIIATVGCYFGMNTKGGTQGVGKATTQAVVSPPSSSSSSTSSSAAS